MISHQILKLSVLLIVLGLFFNIVNAENRIDILTNETFNVQLNADKVAVYETNFNFSVPSHEGNVTLVLEFVNKLESVIYERCYVKEASIYVGGVPIVFKTYDDAQEFIITAEADVTPDFNHTGKIVLFGTSPEGGTFYGTINLYATYVSGSSGGWFDWFPFGDIIFFVMFTLVFGVPIILLVRRRRRRGQEE